MSYSFNRSQNFSRGFTLERSKGGRNGMQNAELFDLGTLICTVGFSMSLNSSLKSIRS